MSKGPKEVIYYYPHEIPGRAFVVAKFRTKEEADEAFKLEKYDATFQFEGKTYQVTKAGGKLRRDTKYPALLLP